MSIYFLLASERSGSNFITKLLNGHSNICGPSTKHIINPVARNLFRYEPLTRKPNWDELLRDMHNLMQVKFSFWKKTFSLDELSLLSQPGDVPTLIKNIFYEEARANGKQHVFVKENHVYEFITFLLLNFPESKYVYLVRDPRDMALSWKKSSNNPGGVVNAARQWKKDQQSNMLIHNQLVKLSKAFLVRYEDLISDSVYWLKDILTFLGVPYEDNILKFYEDEITRKNAANLEAWHNLGKSIISENKNKYIKELNEKEVMAVEKLCFFEMRHLGYEPEFTADNLERFTNDELEEFESFEKSSIVCKRSSGVKMNMEAKKRFYQREVHDHENN